MEEERVLSILCYVFVHVKRKRARNWNTHCLTVRTLTNKFKSRLLDYLIVYNGKQWVFVLNSSIFFFFNLHFELQTLILFFFFFNQHICYTKRRFNPRGFIYIELWKLLSCISGTLSARQTFLTCLPTSYSKIWLLSFSLSLSLCTTSSLTLYFANGVCLLV